MINPIPAEFAECFSCDPETGVITRLVASGSAPAGKIVPVRFRKHKSGYLRPFIRVNDHDWAAHRVIWFLCTGEQPPDMIDHRSGETSDNRMANLRAATPSLNQANKRLYRGRTLPKGASKTASGKYSATIRVKGKRFCLGTHDTPEAAHEAYMEAARRFHGEFARAS